MTIHQLFYKAHAARDFRFPKINNITLKQSKAKMCDGRRHVPLCPLAQLVQTKNKQCKSAIIIQ